MKLQLSIICENTVGRPVPACGEHGFACLLQGPFGCWLFDTGSGSTLLSNLQGLDYDLKAIDGVILSHGHYDHCGGLMPLLQQSGPLRVIAHPEIFRQRFWQGQHEERNISIQYGREELEQAGARFDFHGEMASVAPGLYFSGKIPRSNQLEKGDPHLVRHDSATAKWVEDDFPDDAALAVDTPKGLLVLLGCAHAGLINTVEYFREKLNNQKIHAIVGGTHLGPASDEQFDATVEYLGRLDFDRLGVSHCTGQLRSAQLHARFPNKVFFANVGTKMRFD